MDYRHIIDWLVRGIFTRVKDLARKLCRYSNAYSANSKPIRWKDSDPTRRIRSHVVPSNATTARIVNEHLSTGEDFLARIRKSEVVVTSEK